ncbi:MAG TPA: nucleoside-diphosphate sugar epimerase/dehydratase [Geminicoccaceae bacterium]|nr:nucleoside-diphosphate sugar epimerase/dehydratase [Geminicoccaceae bacterium]
MERVRVWAAGTSLFDKIRVFLHDISMAGASLGLALYLRVGPDLSRGYGDLLIWAVPLFMLIAGSMFLAFGMYRGVWRYTSISDTVALAKAVTASILLFKLSLSFIDGGARLPLSVPLIQWLVLMAMVAGPRLSYRVLCARAPAVPSPLARLARPWSPPIRHAEAIDRRVPVLLVGVGDRAALFIRAIEENAADAAYRVVGILGNGPAQLGRSVHGVPVLGTVDDLAQVIARLEARHQRPQRIILFDEPERLPVERVRRLIGEAERSAIQVARLDQFTEVSQAQPAGPDAAPGPYRLEDLLGREPISLDRAAIVRLIAGRRVLVTGAGGSIGSELCQQIAALGPKRLVLADASEFNLYSVDLKIDEGWPRLQRVPVLLDVRDGARLEAVFAEHRPELVFHAAALKHVPMVEGHPCEGVLTNVIGTRNVADAACRHGTKAMVLISTDKAVNPTSMMGASKRLAEFYCQALDFEGRTKPRGGAAPRFITVRFGNVLGSSGSVIPLFQHQLARGGPLTVTHPEVCRYFMTIQEAVELVLQASAHGVPRPQERGQIYVLDMGEPIKLVDIARRLIRLHGKIPDTDVRLTFVGLRSGEKLYEELFDAEEERQASVTRGVLAARSQPRELGLLRALYEALECAARRGDEPVLERLVTLVLPSYQSSYAAAGEPAASPPEFLPAPGDAGAPAADVPFAQLLRNGDRDRRSQLGSVQ